MTVYPSRDSVCITSTSTASWSGPNKAHPKTVRFAVRSGWSRIDAIHGCIFTDQAIVLMKSIIVAQNWILARSWWHTGSSDLIEVSSFPHRPSGHWLVFDFLQRPGSALDRLVCSFSALRFPFRLGGVSMMLWWWILSSLPVILWEVGSITSSRPATPAAWPIKLSIHWLGPITLIF